MLAPLSLFFARSCCGCEQRCAPEQVGKLLSDLRRLNVALTRAKKKMIVVGSASTLNCCPVTQRMMGVFAARNWVRAFLAVPPRFYRCTYCYHVCIQILHLPRDVTSVFGGPCKDWFVKSFAACNETPTIDWPTHSSTVCDASPSVETVLKLSPVVNEVVQPQSRLSLTKRPRFGLSSSKEITGLRSCGMKEEPPGAPTSSVPVEEMETGLLFSCHSYLLSTDGPFCHAQLTWCRHPSLWVRNLSVARCRCHNRDRHVQAWENLNLNGEAFPRMFLCRQN